MRPAREAGRYTDAFVNARCFLSDLMGCLTGIPCLPSFFSA